MSDPNDDSKSIKKNSVFDDLAAADCTDMPTEYAIPTKTLSPIQRLARQLGPRAYKEAVKSDPTLPIVRRHMRVDEYNANMIGGRHCSRLTIPIINLDQIRAAASALKKLGEELSEVADDQGPVMYKVLAARGIINTYSRRLKGGAEYKGAR